MHVLVFEDSILAKVVFCRDNSRLEGVCTTHTSEQSIKNQENATT